MRKLLYVPLLLLYFSVQALGQNFVPFTYQIGGTLPAPALYDITVPVGTPQVGLTLSTDGASWMSATLSTNTTPSVLTLSVNPGSLAVGHYTSSATVSSSAGSQFFSITLDVSAATSVTLNLSSQALTFNAVAGGTAPATQQIGVTASSTTSATATLAETTCTGSSWLSMSPTGTIAASATSTPLTISVNQTGLTAGTTCTGTVTVTAGTTTQTATVTLNVTATPAVLTLSSTAFTFNAVSGGAAVAAQTLGVTAQTSTSATATMAETTCTGSSWLTLSPTGNFTASATSTTFTISVNQAGLAAGTTCTGTISMTAAAVTQTATVTLNVTSAASSLTLSTTAMTFSAAAGASAPAPQSLTVTAQTITNASAQIAEQTCTGSTWLSMSPTGNFTASASGTNFTVSVSQAGMIAGTTCTGTISITAGGTTQTVTVTLSVAGTTVSTLTVVPSAYTFSAVAGDVAPATMTMAVTAPVAIGATAVATVQTCTLTNWLTLSPAGGFTAGPTTVYFTVGVNQGAMPAGTSCSGLITITAGSVTQTVPVTLSVISQFSAPLTVTPASLTFNAALGGGAPTAQTLTVTAPFNTPATAQVSAQSCNGTWLTISPSGSFTAGSNGTSFTVSVDPTGIASGTKCSGVITMSAASGVRSTTVTLIVADALSATLTFNVSAISFNAVAGGANPAAQTLTVAAPTTLTATAQAAASTCADTNWLALTPTGSFTASPTNTNFKVSVNQSGLAAGTTCTGTISMASPAGTQTLKVTMAVTAPAVPGVSATPTTLAFTYAAGDPKPVPQVVTISGGGAVGTFSVASNAAWLQVSPTCTVTAPCVTPNNGTFNLTVTADPSGLNAGATYNAAIAITGAAQSSGATNVNVTFAISAPVPGIILVTNAASSVTGPVAPGEMISIFADAATPIGPATAVSLNGSTCPAPCTDVPTTMGGVQVTFQPGGVAAPIMYASATQINCMVPYEMLGATGMKVEVKYLGQKSNALALQYSPTQPGIFTSLGTGSGLATVQQYDLQGNYQGQNSSSNPAKAGWYLMFYATGEGIIPAPAVTGRVTNGTNVVPLLGPPAVLIDGLPAAVPYFAEANGLVSGLMQVNAIVPAGVHTGRVSLSLAMNGVSSQGGVVIYTQ
uniref:BACON domain-containing protein n=1 Tax=Solibacter usitatus (strain Ellin6076) TaxID=234267 RepID=Q024U3_SOLUE